MSSSLDVWKNGNSQEIWDHFCGFLDLSVDEFMRLQDRLLMKQVHLLAKCELGRMLMGDQVPGSPKEFRQTVPFTNYSFYEPFLSQKREDILPAKPYAWGCTSGSGGERKWIPITPGQLQGCMDVFLTVCILATSKERGRYRLQQGDILFGSLPPAPYASGIIIKEMIDRYGLRSVPPLDEEYQMSDLPARSIRGFQMALKTGLDLITGLPSVMAKVGEQFGQRRRSARGRPPPRALLRILAAVLKSRLARRPMLPRDLWKLKGLMSGGMDLAAFRDKLEYYWGVEPFEFYAQSESVSFIALQTWKRRDMVFQPYGGFLEFIPESESVKSLSDARYQPPTCLLNELEAGKCYEVVFTSFDGGTFARYRPGDMVMITSLGDDEADVRLPHMLFKGRVDSLIDLGGFTRLSERTIWLALEDAQVDYENWMARKEMAEEHPVLHLYISSEGEVDQESVRQRLHAGLKKYDTTYADLEDMLGWKPLRVTLLPLGVFNKWQEERVAAGADPAFVKDQRMQPPDYAIKRILELSKEVSS